MDSPRAVQNAFSRVVASTLILRAPLSENSIIQELAQRILSENLPAGDTKILFERGRNQIEVAFWADGTMQYLRQKSLFSEKTIGIKEGFTPENCNEYEWLSDRSGFVSVLGDSAALCATSVAALVLGILLSKSSES